MRAAEFGDLRGLIQGLSTGVQAELDMLAKVGELDQRPAGRAAGRALRLAPRPVFLAGPGGSAGRAGCPADGG